MLTIGSCIFFLIVMSLPMGLIPNKRPNTISNPNESMFTSLDFPYNLLLFLSLVGLLFGISILVTKLIPKLRDRRNQEKIIVQAVIKQVQYAEEVGSENRYILGIIPKNISVYKLEINESIYPIGFLPGQKFTFHVARHSKQVLSAYPL